MKKIILITGIIMSLILIYNKEEDYILIPNEAIRVRIIANSNLKSDVEIKEKVKEDLNKEVNSLLNEVETIEEAREKIVNNLDSINNSVDKSLKRLNYNNDYSINYGLNYFPEKEFKGIKYDGGYYESLVVTLGKGEGPNYWCVLYPPLCLIEGNDNEIEYKSYIQELLKKYI